MAQKKIKKPKNPKNQKINSNAKKRTTIKNSKKPKKIPTDTKIEFESQVKKAQNPEMSGTEAKIDEKSHSFFGVLAYLVQIINYTLPAIIGLGCIISLLIYLVARKSFVKFHALQATFLGIIASLVTYILRDGLAEEMFAQNPALVVFPPLFAVGFTLVFILMALKASKTEWTKLPLFGHLSMKFI